MSEAAGGGDKRDYLGESIEQFKLEFKRVLEHLRTTKRHETNITPDMDISVFDEKLMIAWVEFKGFIDNLQKTAIESLDIPNLSAQADRSVKYIQALLQEVEHTGQSARKKAKTDFLAWLLNKWTPLMVDLEMIKRVKPEELADEQRNLREDLGVLVNDVLGWQS